MFLRSNTVAVERVAIDSLRAAEPAVRRHPEKQFKKLCRSLAKYGQVTPILVTPEREIIDLELVWRAQKANGATHVDVIVIKDKSPEEIKALRLMLNRSAMDAVWDNENLRKVLQDLIDLDFDLELTGFDPPKSITTSNSTCLTAMSKRLVQTFLQSRWKPSHRWERSGRSETIGSAAAVPPIFRLSAGFLLVASPMSAS
jgi:hypothetical protein